MILSHTPDNGHSMVMIDVSLTAMAVAVAFCWPGLGSTYFFEGFE
jgi:hypothetical protein